MKRKKKYTVNIRFVNCPSDHETKEREGKIIDILMDNAMRQQKVNNTHDFGTEQKTP